MPRLTCLCGCLLAIFAGPVLAAGAATPDAAASTAAAQPDAPAGEPAAAAGSRPVTLDVIEVHGERMTRAQARQWQTPGSVSIVDGESLRRRAVTNMADALRYTPGVFIQSTSGGDDAVISIRGSNLSALSYDKGGVMQFQDGLPVSSADGANHNRLMDPLAASDVIVANGANALTYGASDLGGAIDLVSRTALNSDPREVHVLGGQHGLFDARASTGGVAGDFDGMLTLADKHFEGYRQHSRERRASLDANGGWKVSDALGLRVFATLIDSRQQLPGALTRAEFDADPRAADPSYVLGNHQLNVKTGRLAAKGTWHFDENSWLEFGASFEVQSLYHPIVDVFDFSTDPPANWFSLLIDTTERTTGGMLRYHRDGDEHSLVAGLNLARTTDEGWHYTNDHGRRGQRTDAIDQRAGDATAFVVDRWNFAPGWTLVYGTQAISTDRDVRDRHLGDGSLRRQRRTYSSLNPRIGLIRALGSYTEAFANVSRVYQAPNNFQLDNDIRKDDSTLEPMQGVSWEVGARGRGPLANERGSWHWSVSYYQARLRNEILSVEDPAQPGTMLSTNYPRTLHAGIEALLGASLPLGDGGWHLQPLVSASWNDFRFNGDAVFGDNRLPMAPRAMLHGELMLRDTATGFYLGPTFDVAGPRYADMANSYRVGGHGIVGLRAGIDRDDWALFVEADNLANRDYVNTVTVLTQAAPDARVLNAGAPRSLFVGFRLDY